MKIVYLNPVSGFNNSFSSDTLWGLLCWGIRHVYGEEVLEKFIQSNFESENKKLLISSAFKFTESDKKKTLFFPKPLLPSFTWGKLTKGVKQKSELIKIYAKIKVFKKLKMLDFDLYKRVISGELGDVDLFNIEDYEKNYPTIKGHFEETDIMHNTIDRYNGSTIDGALFQKTVEFANNSGLFFLIDGEDEHIKLIEGSLRYYGVNGFAGDSATGTNHFKVSVDDFEGFPKVEHNAYTNLSLTTLTRTDVLLFKKNHKLFLYDTVIRKGKIWQGSLKEGSDFWKPSVITFKEGSLFPAENTEKIGSLQKIVEKGGQSPHDIYHYGLGFLVPVLIKGIEQ